MKTPRYAILVVLTVLVSLLLSSCTGGALVNTWPGAVSDGDRIYLAYQGSIYAINASNGTLAWRYPQEKPDASKPFYAAPAISGDLIIAGNYGHQLVALDKNGNLAWSGPFEVETGNFVATPLVVDNTILAPSSNDTLYAVDTSGKQKWTFKANNMLWAQPASDGDLVFVPGLDHNLYALSLSNGQKAWTTDLGSPLLSAPVLVDETLYLGTMEGELIAVSAADGRVSWRTKLDGRIWSSPALDEDVLYVGTSLNKESGSIAAVSVSDGSVLWQKDAGGPVIGGITVIPDGIVFPTENGNLTAWSKDGNQLWPQTINGKLYSTPVVAGQNLVVPVTQGEDGLLLQAFGLNGQVAWPFVPPK